MVLSDDMFFDFLLRLMSKSLSFVAKLLTFFSRFFFFFCFGCCGVGGCQQPSLPTCQHNTTKERKENEAFHSSLCTRSTCTCCSIALDYYYYYNCRLCAAITIMDGTTKAWQCASPSSSSSGLLRANTRCIVTIINRAKTDLSSSSSSSFFFFFFPVVVQYGNRTYKQQCSWQ